MHQSGQYVCNHPQRNLLSLTSRLVVLWNCGERLPVRRAAKTCRRNLVCIQGFFFFCVKSETKNKEKHRNVARLAMATQHLPLEVVITPESSAHDSGALHATQLSPNSSSSQGGFPSQSQTSAAPSNPIVGLVLTGLTALAADSSLADGSGNPGATSSNFTGRVAQLVQTIRQEWVIQPWSLFFDKERVSLRPSGPQAESEGGLGVVYVARKRLPANLKKFQTNYLIVSLLLLGYGVLTTPGLLLLLFTVAGLGYYLLFWRQAPLVVGGHELSRRHTIIGLLVFAAVMTICTTPATSAFTWIATVGFSFILLHATLFQSDEERPDELFSV